MSSDPDSSCGRTSAAPSQHQPIARWNPAGMCGRWGRRACSASTRTCSRGPADLGYDCRWYGLRAADVGAAHGRFRVFLFATPADSDDRGLRRTRRSGANLIDRTTGGHPVAGVGRSALTLLPTPRATDGTKGGPNQRDRPATSKPSPPPDARRERHARTVDEWDASDRMKTAHGNGNGHGKSLSIEVPADALGRGWHGRSPDPLW